MPRGRRAPTDRLRTGDARTGRVGTLSAIDVHLLTGALGARVTGVDLRAPSDDDVRDILHALLRHGVLFFRDQPLSDDEHLALATRFGEPAQFPVTERFVGAGNALGFITDTAESPPDADGWHTDITWIENPPKMAFLQAITVPERGGDTLWADLYAAYDALSEPMRAVCRRLSVVHAISPVIVDAFRARAGDELAEKIAVEFPPVAHPLVRRHPETGRDALFVAGSFMTAVEGMHPDESAMFLSFLNRHIENPNLHVRWSWRPGDLAIWDERCTNHRALSDHYPQFRQMRRCTVKGDRPVGPEQPS